MRGFQTKVYMVQVKPKILASLQNILNGSAADSENLISKFTGIKFDSLRINRG